MFRSIRRWRTRDLFLSWGVYWAVLALVTLGPAARAIWRATHMPEGQGSVGVNFGNWVFNLTVGVGGSTVYTGSIHMLALALWFAGPPLLIWLAWIAARPRVPEGIAIR
jgi:hypothetical protein